MEVERDRQDRRAPWARIAVRLAHEVIHYLQVLLLATFLLYFTRAADKRLVAELLRFGAYSAPLPVGVAFAWSQRSAGASPIARRLRSYAVAAVFTAALGAFLHWR